MVYTVTARPHGGETNNASKLTIWMSASEIKLKLWINLSNDLFSLVLCPLFFVSEFDDCPPETQPHCVL